MLLYLEREEIFLDRWHFSMDNGRILFIIKSTPEIIDIFTDVQMHDIYINTIMMYEL